MRAVTVDHVLFDECIEAFRPHPDRQYLRIPGPTRHSYLFTDFGLQDDWQLPHCLVHKSQRVDLVSSYRAYVCVVDNPVWADSLNSHLYGVALASIVSFATGRLCKSTRTDLYTMPHEPCNDFQLCQLGIYHPILWAGSGSVHTSLTDARQADYKERVSSLITTLHAVSYEKYLLLMQAVRLVHLSLSNKREDFGLAYLLIVSAIESVARKAISRNSVRKQHPSERIWETRAVEDQSFKDLLVAYKDARGTNHYLKERYVRFIERFAPADTWEAIIAHPLQGIADHESPKSAERLVAKGFHEKYPSDLSADEISKMLADSYDHRSTFVHVGKQPPHRQPVSLDRFFQVLRQESDEHRVVETLLPNYELLLGIARHSIRAWAESK